MPNVPAKKVLLTDSSGNYIVPVIDPSDIADKANVDLSNLSETGDNYFVKQSRLEKLDGSLAMPSEKYEDLTLAGSGATYVAPANGYVVLKKKASGANQFIEIVSSSMMTVTVTNASSNVAELSVFLPLKKDDTFQVHYNFGGVTRLFRFVWSNGDL